MKMFEKEFCKKYLIVFGIAFSLTFLCVLYAILIQGIMSVEQLFLALISSFIFTFGTVWLIILIEFLYFLYLAGWSFERTLNIYIAKYVLLWPTKQTKSLLKRNIFEETLKEEIEWMEYGD